MAQVTAREIDSGQSKFPASVVVGTIFPTEGNGVWRDPEYAPIGDSGARDVSTQILQRADSTTAGLNVHAPVFAPLWHALFGRLACENTDLSVIGSGFERQIHFFQSLVGSQRVLRGGADKGSRRYFPL